MPYSPFMIEMKAEKPRKKRYMRSNTVQRQMPIHQPELAIIHSPISIMKVEQP